MKRILVLPYAGGSAEIIANKLKYNVSKEIEVIPIELAGRGRRFGECLITGFDEQLKDVLDQIQKYIYDNVEYALLGYSMGSVLCYELYYEIMKNKWKMPETIFFCASSVPEKSIRNRKLDDASIIDEMVRLGGTSEEVLQIQELMELILPIMRADFQVLNTYEYRKRDKKIECPISIHCGYDDDVYQDIRLWDNYSTEECQYNFYEGGHFFINDVPKEMGENIALYYIENKWNVIEAKVGA